jgi:transcriptional regulator with XRE-family HTH domain
VLLLGSFVKTNDVSDGANMTDATSLGATIAGALRRERERAGLSLTELARRAGIAKSTLSQLEAGDGNPSVETLWALGVALGVPFAVLVDQQSNAPTLIRADDLTGVPSSVAAYSAAYAMTAFTPSSDVGARWTSSGAPQMSSSSTTRR